MEDETIKGNFIIQIAGKPQNKVDQALNTLIEKIKEEQKLKEYEIEESEYDEESTLYSGLVEVGIKFNTVRDLLEFIVDYTPNSVEIESPENIKLDNSSLSAALNDFSSHILKSNQEVRKLRAQIHSMKKKESANKEDNNNNS